MRKMFRQKGRIGLCCFIGMLLGMTLSQAAFAEPVAMILTERKAAYEKAASAVENRLAGEVKSYDMKNSRSRDDKITAQIEAQGAKVVIAIGDKAALLAAERLSAYPVVIGMVLDMDREAFQQPNIEGVGLQIPAQSVLTQLRFIMPQMKRIGIVSSGQAFNTFRASIRSYGGKAGLSVADITAPDKELIQDRLDSALPGLDAVWLLPDPKVIDAKGFHAMVKKIKAAGKALVVYSENFVKAGALFSVSPDYKATGQQLALLAKKILGKEDVTPKRPYLSKFHYPIGSYSVLNIKTAKDIGLNVTQSQMGFINRIINDKS